MKVKRESEVVQSGLTPSDPMDCSPPGSSIHGIFQTSVLEWGAIAFSKQYMQCAAKSLLFLGHIWDPRILHVHLLCAILSCVQFFVTHDCSPPGSSVHGIFQTRVLKWGAIAFSAGTHYSITNIICNTKELKTISLSIHSTSIH